MVQQVVQAACSFEPVPLWHEKMAKRDATYTRLMASSIGCRNSHLLARMIASWCVGDGVLPKYFNEISSVFQQLMSHNFPKSNPLVTLPSNLDTCVERLPEREDLIRLLVDERAGTDENELWIAEIIATACMGSDHLWQDLGMWSRTELSDLLQHNFPTLAARNIRDMKWKKFLYKQLCDKHGVYVCRAPSCDVCADFNVCFGAEE